MRYLVRSLPGLGLLSVLALGLDAGSLLAQRQKPGEPRVLTPGERSVSQFQLFSDRDFAVGGFRLAGVYTGCTDNSGNITTPDQCFWPFGSTAPGGEENMPNWFDIFFYVAAPPSERDKHAATVPSLANARGKGYTVNSRLSQFTAEMHPHDGTLGPFHAGATSRNDGSCLDISTDRGPFGEASGEPMLAHSDCPETWGSAGWQGTRNVDADGFLAWADQVLGTEFAFDPWRVPAELQRTDKFLGGFQTFGYFSDYSNDALFGSGVHPSYGNVIPSGDPAADPTRPGWPLGILVKMDAFSFGAPGLLNTVWFQFTVTNNSFEVYGVPLDYDSLYMGLQPGWFPYEQGGSLYRDPKNNVIRMASFCQGFTNSSSKGASGNGCGPGGDPAHSASAWGTAPPNGIGAGFNYGAAAMVVLKSPIGDLRNKLLSTDPRFIGKGDPAIWDDTITFNHGHMCGFHGCSAVLWNAPGSTAPNTDYEQRQFGMVASIPRDVVGDRILSDPASINDHVLWDTWRYEEYPDRNQVDFNRWTPGNWDWNDDGIDDELAWDDCSDNSGEQLDPFTGGSKKCAVAWSDTLPNGFGNVYSNRGAVTGVGPIQMAAFDTVQWVVALVHAEDFASIEADIARAVDHYMAFYLGPEAAPAPAITSVEVQAGGGSIGPDGQPEAVVTLYFDATTEDWEDPFLAKFLTDMLAADPATELGRIRDLNPFLEDTLRALIANNVEAIHVFKSCDGGGGFTDDSDCNDDPAAGDGVLASLGWLPWATLEPNPQGEFDNVISDNGVFGGRTFLYSLLSETRGLEVAVQTGEVLDTIGVAPDEEVICISGCGSQILSIAPKIVPAIATATGAPNVASVYLPISQQAGSRRATVEVVTESPDFVPFARMGVRATTDEVADGRYQLLFGDQVEVTETATQTPTGFDVQSTTVVVTDGDEVSATLTAPGPVGVEGSFSESIVGDQRTRVWTFDALTAVLATADGVPLTATSDLAGGQTVPGRYFGLANFPGFTMSADAGLSGFSEQFYLDAGGEQIGPLVEPSVTFLNADAAAVTGEGRYRINWSDEAFGGAPFQLDLGDPEGTRDRVLTSLGARSVTTASTDADIASFIGLPVEALVPARLPFTIQNITDANNPTPVAVVVPRSGKQTSLLLGDGQSVLTVAVDETEWLPGDELVLVEGSAPDFEVTFGTAIVGCEPTLWRRRSCNPVSLASPGATGYIANAGGQELHLEYHQTITSVTEFTFDVQSAETGMTLTANEPEAIRAALDSVKVVPNPFLMFSEYSTQGGEDRIIFTHMPPRGVLRVFSVSGHFVQEIVFGPDDLNARGDMFFNLRTREGNEMAAGLYLYVLEAWDENQREIGTAKGKFVLIK